ncbi:MAG: hypothetical protein A2033_01145 [Bacteroidetes bacterium GWA2_31_9]|nr:MAG: hypothetical protein A2033_01145 [Bacteroidetes bacterium GWA2_31_9]
MNKLNKISLILVFLLFALITFSQEIPDGIQTALKTGNATELAKYFNTNVEMTVINKEDVYSKSQAEIILRDFFSNNTPTEFKLMHKGGKDGAKYAIGNLKTTTKTYRVYFLVKNNNKTPYIQQLRIEESDE